MQKNTFRCGRKCMPAAAGCLKFIELYNVQRIQNRWFPTRMVYKDMLKTGGDKFHVESIV